MKIKYKILASLLIVGGLSLQSCDSVFDELAINPNQPSMKTYFTTPEGVNDAVTTMYGYISTQRCLGASGSKTQIIRGDEASHFSYSCMKSICKYLLISYQQCSVCSPEKLLMVSASGVDLVGPVDLLQKHHPQQVVGKGHGGHGQPQSGLPLQGFVHPEGTANEKNDVAGALGGAVRQIAGQLLAGALPPLHTHGDHQTAVGQLGPDSVPFSAPAS